MSPRVVILGGGVAGLEAALTLRDEAPGGLRVDLVAADETFVEWPVTTGEPFELATARRRHLTSAAPSLGVRFHHTSARAVSLDRGEVDLATGGTLPYDALLVALGARRRRAVAGALTVPGEDGLDEVIARIESGALARVAFAQPPGASWPVPLLELALGCALRAREAERTPELSLVTPEAAPLHRFGPEISRDVAELLSEAGIRVLGHRTPVRFAGRHLRLVPQGFVRADAVVAVPRLFGHHLSGLPCDADGFVLAGSRGRVPGARHVWAAGDGSSTPLKHGSVGAASAALAARDMLHVLGLGPQPEPEGPVIRAVVAAGLTGRRIEADLSGRGGDPRAPRPVTVDWSHGKLDAPHLVRWLEETAPAGVDA